MSSAAPIPSSPTPPPGQISHRRWSEARWRGSQVPVRKRVEARDGLIAAPPARHGRAGHPKGGRYLKYRPGWTVFQIPSTPGCLLAVGSVLCGSDWKHLNPLERPSSSPVARRARQPVAASGEQERLARFAGDGTAAASGGSSAIACVRGSALYLLWFPARLVVVPRSVTGRRWTRRQDWRGGVRKLLALELARQKRPQSPDSARCQRRACPERAAAAVLLLLRGVWWSSLSGSELQRHAAGASMSTCPESKRARQLIRNLLQVNSQSQEIDFERGRN